MLLVIEEGGPVAAAVDIAEIGVDPASNVCDEGEKLVVADRCPTGGFAFAFIGDISASSTMVFKCRQKASLPRSIRSLISRLGAGVYVLPSPPDEA